LVDDQQTLGIDARTATPDWDGLEMDVELVLQALVPGPLPARRDAPVPAPGGCDAGAGAGGVSAETSSGQEDRVSAETPEGDDGRQEHDADPDARWRPLRIGGEDDPGDDSPPDEG